MKGLNKVTLIGNIGRDPEFKILDGDLKVAKISVATTEILKNHEGKKTEYTEWHNVIAWQKLADFAKEYLKTGMLVYVEGRLKTRQYTDNQAQRKFVTEIIADKILILDKKSVS